MNCNHRIVFTVCCFLACSYSTAAVFAANDQLPTAKEVGPAAMPVDIAPIEAPFEMPELSRPEFGEQRFELQFDGGHENGELVTSDIQRAVDEMSAAGGGTVVLPAGTWQTGRIVLKSGVNLHIPAATTLKFSGRIEDHLPVVFARYEGLDVMSLGGLIYAHQAERIAVTGGGKLIGPDNGPVREIQSGLSNELIDPNSPIEQRVMDGLEGRHYFRPQFICLMNCRNVLIEGVHLRNGPFWNIVPTYCEQVIIRGVTVESRGVGNGDGVNVESSRNVLVEYCRVNTGDDCYAMKAGRGLDGVRAAKPVENVVLRFCHALGGFGGVTCGSETAGGIRDVYVHDCVFDDVRHAVYMKTRRPRGGGVERLTIERLRFTSYNIGIMFDMIGSPTYVGELGYRLPRRAITNLTPYYRQITMRDIDGVCSKREALKIKGIPESPASDLTMERVAITAPGLINLADVKDVTIRDSMFRSESSELRFLDAINVNFENCQLLTDGKPPTINVAGEYSEKIRFVDSEPSISSSAVQASNGANDSAVMFESL